MNDMLIINYLFKGRKYVWKNKATWFNKVLRCEQEHMEEKP